MASIDINSINFFTPIKFEGQKKTFKQNIQEGVEDYFFLKGKAAFVIPGKVVNESQEVKIKFKDQSKIKQVILGAIKVISYMTIAIPLIMLAAKAIFRGFHKFHIVPKVKLIPSSSPLKPVPSSIKDKEPAPSLIKDKEPAPSLIKDKEPVVVNNTPEDRAAITIQKYIRRHFVKKSFLPNGLFTQYKEQCSNASGANSQTMPQAEGGKTRVYLPAEMSEVVLKRSGRKDAIKRFHQMQDVRAILNSQKASHLIIPKANLCGEFLLEERLPINVDSYHNMGAYLSGPELFDDAVREMTRLFSKIYLSDLVNEQCIPLGHIEGIGDFVRYDNLPLYIEEVNGERKGQIGLVDLEHNQASPSRNGLKTLVRIFPLHLDLIKEEASKLGMAVNNEELEISAEKGRQYLQVGYSSHLEWLQEKGSLSEVATQIFDIDSKRQAELNEIVEKELIKLNQGINDYFVKQGFLGAPPDKNFLTGSLENVAKELAAAICPMIIGNTKAVIAKKQQEKLEKIGERELSQSEVVSLRSPILKRSILKKGVEDFIRDHENVKFNTGLFSDDAPLIVSQLLEVVINELVSGGELFLFDPAYYTGGNESCWIRY